MSDTHEQPHAWRVGFLHDGVEFLSELIPLNTAEDLEFSIEKATGAIAWKRLVAESDSYKNSVESITKERDKAQKIAGAAMWEADRLRAELRRARESGK